MVSIALKRAEQKGRIVFDVNVVLMINKSHGFLILCATLFELLFSTFQLQMNTHSVLQ